MKADHSDKFKPELCLVAHFAYGALAGKRKLHIGGVEHQTSLMARWFAAQGYRVSMITWNEGQPDGVEIDGVRVFRMCDRGAGLRGLRFFHPRWTSLASAMRRANADLYYQNCAEYVTGQVALWCKWHARKFVYSIANDPDVDPRLPDMQTVRERMLYRYGLQHADRVVVQTQSQAAALREGFGLDSVVLPMPCPGPSNDDQAQPERLRRGSPRILWVARICEQKRPDRLLDIAEACPELEFDLVGPASGAPYSSHVCERASLLRNVTVHGGVLRHHMADFYKAAACMCCTSNFEGFPNTFLEAWSHGLPVVSTFDPDNLIAERAMGAVADDVPGLVSAIHGLLTSQQRWSEASKNARRYYLENHAVDKVMPRFERVFLDLLGRNTDSQR